MYQDFILAKYTLTLKTSNNINNKRYHYNKKLLLIKGINLRNQNKLKESNILNSNNTGPCCGSSGSCGVELF